MAPSLPYYYAAGGKYVLFLDLLGFTSFVRASFQKVAEATDHKERAYKAALDQFKRSQVEVDRAYRRFHEHLELLYEIYESRGRADGHADDDGPGPLRSMRLVVSGGVEPCGATGPAARSAIGFERLSSDSLLARLTQHFPARVPAPPSLDGLSFPSSSSWRALACS